MFSAFPVLDVKISGHHDKDIGQAKGLRRGIDGRTDEVFVCRISTNNAQSAGRAERSRLRRREIDRGYTAAVVCDRVSRNRRLGVTTYGAGLYYYCTADNLPRNSWTA
jgi:hypothetical protein